jgi:hypothetical protein
MKNDSRKRSGRNALLGAATNFVLARATTLAKAHPRRRLSCILSLRLIYNAMLVVKVRVCVYVAIVVILMVVPVLLDVPRELERVTQRDRGREDENEVYGVAAEKVVPHREGK